MNETLGSPFDLYLPDLNPKEGTPYIYYKLFSNGTRYWYYPMTGTTTGNIITPPITGTEFEQALAWMYSNGLTMYDNEIEYRPDDGLLREEAAKIIGQAFIVLGYEQTTKNNNCIF